MTSSTPTVEDLQTTLDSLRLEHENALAKIEEMEDALADLRTEVVTLREADVPYRNLVEAASAFLSWQDSPPPGMSAAEVALIGRTLRGQLDDALREAR